MSRFRTLLIKCEKEYGRVSELITELRHALMEEVDNLSQRISYDSKAIDSFPKAKRTVKPATISELQTQLSLSTSFAFVFKQKSA